MVPEDAASVARLAVANLDALLKDIDRLNALAVEAGMEVATLRAFQAVGMGLSTNRAADLTGQVACRSKCLSDKIAAMLADLLAFISHVNACQAIAQRESTGEAQH